MEEGQSVMSKASGKSGCVQLNWIAWSWMAVMTAIVYAGTKKVEYSLFIMAGCSVFCVILLVQNQINRTFTRELVLQLDLALDNLMRVEKCAVFEENKENLASKLQSKIFRLSGILQQQREQEKKEHEKIKTLVSDLSHQLKTPIANLKMYGELLQDKSLSESDREIYMNILQATIDKLQFLTEGLIKMSRLESGLIKLHMQEQNLSEALLRALKSVYGMAKSKHMEIVYKQEEEVVLCHDSNWTSEAVYNLLDNAVKYGTSGNPIILQTKNYGMFVEIMVKDTNEPIAKEERHLVFKRFYRGKQQREKEGIGVGLYLAKEIAEKQGGYMRLHVKESGNCFSIVLPK